jgi:hypothetical protein
MTLKLHLMHRFSINLMLLLLRSNEIPLFSVLLWTMHVEVDFCLRSQELRLAKTD